MPPANTRALEQFRLGAEASAAAQEVEPGLSSCSKQVAKNIALRYSEDVPEPNQSDAEIADFEGAVAELAAFRYSLRKFLRFSESAARRARVTPQQHQLMLGIAGFTGAGKATVSELAEFLQERHHSVVGLIDRAEVSGLVRRESDPSDRRVVNVSLTAHGRSILRKLSLEHREELYRMREELLRFARKGAPRMPVGHSAAHISEKEGHRTATRL